MGPAAEMSGGSARLAARRRGSCRYGASRPHTVSAYSNTSGQSPPCAQHSLRRPHLAAATSDAEPPPERMTILARAHGRRRRSSQGELLAALLEGAIGHEAHRLHHPVLAAAAGCDAALANLLARLRRRRFGAPQRPGVGGGQSGRDDEQLRMRLVTERRPPKPAFSSSTWGPSNPLASPNPAMAVSCPTNASFRVSPRREASRSVSRVQPPTSRRQARQGRSTYPAPRRNSRLKPLNRRRASI